LSPRSLISGRWAEINTTESKNSREVSVIELTDHSPGPYCPARKRLNFAESDGSCSNDTKSPIKKNNGNHSIPSLTKSESVLPLFVENNMDGNGRSNDSPTNYSPNKVPMSQLMIIQTCDLSPLIGPPEYETCVCVFYLKVFRVTHVMNIPNATSPHIEMSLN
jgi:hypothetical protein